MTLGLYAGGLKSHADVLALPEANPSMDRDALRDLCRGWGLLAGLETVLRELD